MEIKKILWPNDFTPTAHRVLPFVESLVETYGASLHLIHVAMDISRYGDFYGKPTPEHVKEMHEFMLEGARKKLAEFCEDELASCPTYEFHVKLGEYPLSIRPRLESGQGRPPDCRHIRFPQWLAAPPGPGSHSLYPFCRKP